MLPTQSACVILTEITKLEYRLKLYSSVLFLYYPQKFTQTILFRLSQSFLIILIILSMIIEWSE